MKGLSVAVAVCLLIMMVAGSAAAGELSLTSNATLTFAPVNRAFLNYDSNGKCKVTAMSGPSYVISDTTGTGSGWSLMFECQPLVNASNSQAKLPVAYEQTAAQVICLDGQAVNSINGPAMEFVRVESLNMPQIVLNSYPGFGKGTYSFSTSPQDFSVEISHFTTLSGSYNGSFATTLTSGPSGSGAWGGTIR